MTKKTLMVLDACGSRASTMVSTRYCVSHAEAVAA